jgi:hypothetical protein
MPEKWEQENCARSVWLLGEVIDLTIANYRNDQHFPNAGYTYLKRCLVSSNKPGLILLTTETEERNSGKD